MPKSILLCTGLLAVAATSAGCNSPKYRLPGWMPADPPAEKLSYERHDPFPDRGAGPETMNRPRGYELPRTRERQLYDERLLQGGAPAGPYPGAQPPVSYAPMPRQPAQSYAPIQAGQYDQSAQYLPPGQYPPASYTPPGLVGYPAALGN